MKQFLTVTAPPCGRPLVFDSISPTIAYLEDRKIAADRRGDLIGGFAAMLEQAQLVQVANNGLAFLPEIIAAADRYGVDFAYWPSNMDTPDTLHGSNRYAIFPELMTRDIEGAILASFAPDIKRPAYTTAQKELEDPQDRTEPYVLKDTLINRGINKLLVEKPEDHEKVVKFLSTLGPQELEHILLEDFIETPTEYGTSYRVTTTATGHIQAATLNRSSEPLQLKPVEKDDVTEAWVPLVDPSSSLYIAPRKITSNIISGGKAIPLQTDTYSLVNTRRNYEDEDVLIFHGIDERDPRLPTGIADVAVNASLALGPSLGLQLGVDVLVDRGLNPYLLEVNNWPSPVLVQACWGSSFSDDQVFLAAVERFFCDLASKEKK
jgi:hypothetical protein